MKTFEQAWQEFEARKRVTVTFETFKAGFEAGQSCKSPDPQAAESGGRAGGEQSPSVPVIAKFFDLPLGTRFRYVGQRDDVWVKISNADNGLVAAWRGWKMGVGLRQSICSAENSREEMESLEVEIAE